MSGDKFFAVLLSFFGALVVTGILALIDWLFTPSWPTWMALTFFSLVGCCVSVFSLVSISFSTSRERFIELAFIASVIGSIVGWIVLSVVFVFIVWQRHSLSSVWYGVCWFMAVGVTSYWGVIFHERWERKHNPRSICPECGRIMRYTEEYDGSINRIDAYGQGTRTPQYKSVYKCKKCGYKRDYKSLSESN